jgi:hypothetical protein
MPAPPTESSDVPALASPRARGPLGKLTIDATPWASISMSDGKARRDLGLTPVEVEVPGGTYTLTADNAEMGKREQKKVKVKPGSVLKVRFTMNGDEP